MHILADSTYGSCCVDEKTAKHVCGDSLIHFGLSCLSATQRIPVLFIFTKPNVSIDEGVSAFRKTFQPSDEVLILFDVIYESVSKEMFENLCSTHPHTILANLMIPGAAAEKGGLIIHGRRIETCTPTEDIKKVFYVGSNERTLLNFLLRLPSAEFLIFDPKTLQLKERRSHVMKLLMRRNYYMERLKDASTVGILVGTLAVESYLSIIAQIRETLASTGKKFYIVSIGEITPPKLANFPDIEVRIIENVDIML